MTLRLPFIICFLLLVTFGLYYPVVFAPFNSVDDWNMLESLINAGDITLPDLLFPSGTGYYYRPLLYYTFVLDRNLWGMQESIMHFENIALHGLNTVLVFFVASTLMKLTTGRQDKNVPFFAALIFSIHPINTEAVNWISGRTDVLAGTFILVALLGLLNAIERHRSYLFIFAAISYLFACLCKETAIFFLPGAILILFARHTTNYAWFQAFKERRRYLSASYFFVATAVYFAMRYSALSHGDSGIKTAIKGTVGSDVNLFYNIKVFLKVLGFYSKKILFPWPQSFAIVSASDLYIFVGMLLMMLCLFLLVRRDLISGMALTGVALACAALLVVMSRMAWTPIAERYLYLPCIAFCASGAVASRAILTKIQSGRVVSFVFVVALSVVSWTTVERNIVWQNNLSLFTDTVRKAPDFPPARNELAVALNTQGRSGEARELFKNNHLESSLKNREYGVLNAAGSLASDGKLDEAHQMLVENLDRRGKHYAAILKKLVEVNERRIKAAGSTDRLDNIRRENVKHLIELNKATGDPFYYYRVGQAYLALNDNEAARGYFILAASKSPEGAYYREPARKLATNLGAVRQ